MASSADGMELARATARAMICAVCRKGVDAPTQCGPLAAKCRFESMRKNRPSSPMNDIGQTSDGGHFDCNICLQGCEEPVVTQCGHLFCWPCLYCWLSLHSVSQECPICRADVRDRIIPLYAHGRAEGHSRNAVASMFSDMHIPCRPLPSRNISEAAVSTNTVISHGNGDHDHDHAIQVSEMETRIRERRSADHAGLFASMLRCCMGSLPAFYCGGFLCGRQSTASNAGALVHQLPRHRYSNEKEFLLHWAFIVVASIAILSFTTIY